MNGYGYCLCVWLSVKFFVGCIKEGWIMASKVYIGAVCQGVPQGYVQSVSYVNGSFRLTMDRSQAKKYTEDQAHSEIDILTRWCNERQMGYVFVYGIF